MKTRGPLHSARWSGGLGRLGPLGAGGRSRLVAGLGGALVPTRGDGLVAGHGLPTTPAPPSSTSSSLLLTLPLFSIHAFPFPPPPSPTRPILLLFSQSTRFYPVWRNEARTARALPRLPVSFPARRACEGTPDFVVWRARPHWYAALTFSPSFPTQLANPSPERNSLRQRKDRIHAPFALRQGMSPVFCTPIPNCFPNLVAIQLVFVITGSQSVGRRPFHGSPRRRRLSQQA